MSDTVYEFPLKEKVRNYLRIEQLIAQLKSGASAPSAQLQMYFFDQLFTLLDLFERIDIRTDYWGHSRLFEFMVGVLAVQAGYR